MNPGTATCPRRLLVCSICSRPLGRRYPQLGSREEVFRSAEVRPLAADGPLRVGPQRWLPLEAWTTDHQLPLGSTLAGGPSRLRSLPPSFSRHVPRSLCYHTTRPLHHRRAASASASTPPATATTPPSSATTSSPPPTNCNSPRPPLATPCSGNGSNASSSATGSFTSSSVSTLPGSMPTIYSTSCTASALRTPALPAWPRPWP